MDMDTKKLFQITEAAHACSLSRSTLLRLEERGLLTPAYTAPESGRRYYDNHNVARIMQIEKLRAMGLTTEEIAGYFSRGGDVSEMLAALEARLETLRRGVEELRLRAEDEPGISVQMMTLPAITCCLHWFEGYTYVHRDTAPADAETLPPCRALSVLCCGGYGEINEAWLTLGREVRARALTPTAPPRVLGIVAPYTGREIEERRYCSRIVLPVEG